MVPIRPLLAFALVQGCSLGTPDPIVSGVVVDHAGRPLDGVQVSVKQSAYASTTGADGSYTVPFAPGSFSLAYQKDGWTSTTVSHEISGAVEFPAAEVRLFPRPAEPGVFFIGGDAPQKLAAASMDKQRVSEGWTTTYKYFCTGEGGLVLPAGKVSFIDTSPATMLPAKAGGYGLILHTGREAPAYNGVFQDSKERVGDEKLVLRSFDVEPGNYAFVAFASRSGGEKKLDADAGCLPFRVESAGE